MVMLSFYCLIGKQENIFSPKTFKLRYRRHGLNLKKQITNPKNPKIMKAKLNTIGTELMLWTATIGAMIVIFNVFANF